MAEGILRAVRVRWSLDIEGCPCTMEPESRGIYPFQVVKTHSFAKDQEQKPRTILSCLINEAGIGRNRCSRDSLSEQRWNQNPCQPNEALFSARFKGWIKDGSLTSESTFAAESEEWTFDCLVMSR